MGILSLSSFKMINGMEDKKKGYKVQIETNGVRLSSGVGEETDLVVDKEETYALQTADGQVMESMFKQGNCYYLAKDFTEPAEFDQAGLSNDKTVVQWASPNIFNFFCSSTLDTVEIKLF